MTIRDSEVLHLLRDDPELLAVADAVGETQKLPTRRRWIVPGSLAAVGAAAAAVALVVLFWPGGGSDSILERARAAIGDGPVLHIVTRSPTGHVLVDLRSGRRVVETYETESWIDRDATHLHMVVRNRGKVVGDVVLPDDARDGELQTPGGPAYEALWTGYRRALDSGEAKIVGNGAIYDHAVYWVRFPASPGLTSSDVAIDQQTYKPVAFRLPAAPGRFVVMRVLVFETTSFRSSDFRRAGRSLLGGTTSNGGSEATPVPAPAWPRIIRPPWLTLGRSFRGLRLTSVSPVTATFDGRRSHGVSLVYGRTPHGFEMSGRHAFVVSELARPDDPAAWRGIPTGYVRIEEQSRESGRSTTTVWSGSAVRHGIYVKIESGRGEADVVAIARALHPA